jgi:NAD(P)H dehydrogenase (quinone)
MQVLVLYYSKTGRTQAMAESIVEGVQEVDGVEVVLRTTSEVTEDDFVQSSAVIAGSPVYFGEMAAELKSVFDRFIGIRKQMVGKVGAAFASSNDPSGGKETTLLSILQTLLIYGMMVIGDPMETGGHYGASAAGELTAQALQTAQAHGAHIARTLKRLT